MKFKEEYQISKNFSLKEYQKIDAPPRLKSHGLKRCSIFGCKKFLLEEKFLHRSLSCQSVSEEHFEHPKVLTTLQKGLFDCEQTSCAQSVDHILKNVVLGKHFDIKT